MRHEVFLPNYLPRRERNAVYRLKNRKAFESEPVVVRVGGDEFKLRSLWDRPVPTPVKCLREAVRLMKHKKDWDNLPAMLEGLNVAGVRLSSPILSKLVRKAGQLGRQDVIFECAKRVERTGFVMKDLPVVQSIMWWIQYRALSDNWSLKETTRALKMAEQVSVLLEEKNHAGGPLRDPLDPRARPETIGILLQLAAAQAKLLAGTENDGKIKLYANRLLGSLRDGVDFSKALVPAGDTWWRKDALLFSLSPVVYGLRLAVEMLPTEPEMVHELRQQETHLSSQVSTARETLLKEIPVQARPLGLSCYDKLFGSESFLTPHVVG